MAVYCTFSTEVPDGLLGALGADLRGMMQVGWWEVHSDPGWTHSTHTHACTCSRTRAHTHTSTCAHIAHTCSYAHMCTHACMHTHSHTHTHARTHTHTYTHAHARTHTHTHTAPMHKHTQSHTHTHAHALAHMHTNMCTCMRARTPPPHPTHTVTRRLLCPPGCCAHAESPAAAGQDDGC